MADEADLGVEYRPLALDPNDPDDTGVLAELRARAEIECRDLRGALTAEFAGLTDPPALDEGPESDRWFYYPWRRAVLGLPGPKLLRAVRLDRNRNKVTRAEQDRLATLAIGVVGQSVGHSIAYTLAQEGACGALRLADFDELELSNLNRVPGTLFDIAVNKAIVTARRIAELDPYLPVEVWSGVDADTADAFLDGLNLVVEECDSLDIKLLVREAARRRRIPLLMETGDRGLLDVERFDLDPERKPFHGLLGDIKAAELSGLSTRDKAPHVVQLLGPDEVSTRMAASLVEVGETLTSWPQLGGDIALGAAGVAAAVRRIAAGRPLPSGRTRVDVEHALDMLTEPEMPAEPRLGLPGDEATAAADATPIRRILECARRAPSGGNAQPWSLRASAAEIRIELDPRRTSALDVGHRGSAVAVGAALYNARAAAAALGMLGPHRWAESVEPDAPLTAILYLGSDTDPALAADYTAALTRETNRRLGCGGVLTDRILADLAAAVTAEGATLRALTRPAEIGEAARVLAESDRIRYLTPHLHRELFAELRGAGDDLDDGIDLRSLELAPDEHAALRIARRDDVMAALHRWSAGAALGDYIRDRVLSSSAIVAVTFSDTSGSEPGSLRRYAEAGAAVQRLWIQAERSGLAVQPVSPVFLMARDQAEVAALSEPYADRLTELQGCFLELLGVPPSERMALVLRLSYAGAASVRSRRRPASGAESRG